MLDDQKENLVQGKLTFENKMMEENNTSSLELIMNEQQPDSNNTNNSQRSEPKFLQITGRETSTLSNLWWGVARGCLG